jgi:hypothetical protein
MILKLRPLISCLSKKRAAGAKRGMVAISEVSGIDEVEVSCLQGASPKSKPSVGKTGVEFCYYKPPEYNLLQPDQKAELKEFRENKTGNASHGKAKKPCNNNHHRDDSKQKKWIASAVEKQLVKRTETQDENATESAFKSYIYSLVSEAKKPATAVNATSAATIATEKKITLQSILRKAKR